MARSWDEIIAEKRFRFSLCSSCMHFHAYHSCEMLLDERRGITKCPHDKYKFYATQHFPSEATVKRAFPENWVEENNIKEGAQ